MYWYLSWIQILEVLISRYHDFTWLIFYNWFFKSDLKIKSKLNITIIVATTLILKSNEAYFRWRLIFRLKLKQTYRDMYFVVVVEENTGTSIMIFVFFLVIGVIFVSYWCNFKANNYIPYIAVKFCQK